MIAKIAPRERFAEHVSFFPVTMPKIPRFSFASLSRRITARARNTAMNIPLIKHPSAWIPIALSLTVVAAMLVHIATVGVPVRQLDEGAGAHLFQIWLVIEVLMLSFFAVRFLPQRPKQAVIVLGIQILAVLAGCAPVFYFKL